jgi:ribosomal protein L40E
MKYLLLILCVCTVLAIGCITVTASADSQTGYFSQQGTSAHTGFRQGPPTSRTWLILIGALAGFALLFLIVLEIGGGGLLPYRLENFIAKFCIGIIITALCLYGYYMSESIVFIILLPFAIGILFFVNIKKAVMRVYMKNLGQPSASNLWICRKCGTENSVIINECHNCHSPRIETKQKSAEEFWTCENCKNTNSLRDRSCRKCGNIRQETI